MSPTIATFLFAFGIISVGVLLLIGVHLIDDKYKLSDAQFAALLLSCMGGLAVSALALAISMGGL